MAVDREEAVRVNKTWHSLDMAMRGLWEARASGDKDGFTFFRESVVKYAEYLACHVITLKPKDWVPPPTIEEKPT